LTTETPSNNNDNNNNRNDKKSLGWLRLLELGLGVTAIISTKKVNIAIKDNNESLCTKL
jgi:hypothetical protein